MAYLYQYYTPDSDSMIVDVNRKRIATTITTMGFVRRPTLVALTRRHMSTTLHTTKVEGASSTVFLHGLLGNGKNLKTLATKFGGGSLLDLRGHGKSPSGSHPHTFESCAKDVLKSVGPAPSATIVGHSFGGRVALECAVLNTDRGTATTTWLLDTVPGEINESVEQVISAIQSINPHNYENRQQLAKALHQEQKLEVGLAQWLASSMTTSLDGLAWGFDVNVVNALLPEFGSQDFMGKLEYVVFSANQKSPVHLVRGAKNNGWTTELVSTLQNLASRSKGRFHLHYLAERRTLGTCRRSAWVSKFVGDTGTFLLTAPGYDCSSGQFQGNSNNQGQGVFVNKFDLKSTRNGAYASSALFTLGINGQHGSFYLFVLTITIPLDGGCQ